MAPTIKVSRSTEEQENSIMIFWQLSKSAHHESLARKSPIYSMKFFASENKYLLYDEQ
jgi:hypothetical protein